MNILSSFRLPTVFIFAVLVVAGFTSTTRAANRYVDISATGSTHNGLSWATAWTSFASITQSSLSGDDIVWIKSGTYNERFTIGKSGTNGHRITYVGTGPTRPVLRGIHGGAFTDIAIINLEIAQLSTANTYDAILLAGASRWLIEDNYIHDTYLSGISSVNNPLSTFNIIRHNTFADLGSIAGGSAGGSSGTVVVNMIGNFNLIEYNTIVHSMDRFRVFGTGNVVRNNYLGPTDTSFYPNSQPYPFHTDGLQSFNGAAPLVQFLYERNYDVDNRDSVGRALPSPAANGHSFIVQDTGSNGFNWYIIRFNLTVREADSVAIFYNVKTVRFYNNTMAGNAIDHTTIYNSAVGWDSGSAPSDDYDFRNNTFVYSPNEVDSSGLISTANRATNFTSAANHSFNLSGSMGVLPTGALLANLAQTNPLFVDGTGAAGHDDYTLQSGSPLRGTGAPLTTATGVGISSSTLTVADGKRLFDGWGIADADWIKIGIAGPYVQIASISGNTVTLTAPQTWILGDGVWVKGSEDVGALPYAHAKPFAVTQTSPPLTAGVNTLSATVDNPDAVRMVEFLVDGIPVGLDYSAPYNATYTSDGNSHNVIVRAYNAWASATLVNEGGGAPNNAKIGITIGP